MNKQELEKTIEQGDALVIDIREADELEAVPIVEGAVHMPMGKVFTEVKKGNLHKDQPIVAICATSGRCQIVKEALEKTGFSVDMLDGGLAAH